MPGTPVLRTGCGSVLTARSKTETEGRQTEDRLPEAARDRGQADRGKQTHRQRQTEADRQTEGQRDRDKDELLSRTLLKNRCCFKEPSLKPVLL